MTIFYEYVEYKNCPEATNISQRRSLSQKKQSGFAFLLFLMGLLGTIFGDFSFLILLAISILWYWYLFKIHPKVTERQIQEALNRQKLMNEKLVNTKLIKLNYSCYSIKETGDTIFGVCRHCRKENVFLVRCAIKNEIGTKYRYLCKECISNFKSESQKGN